MSLPVGTRLVGRIGMPFAGIGATVVEPRHPGNHEVKLDGGTFFSTPLAETIARYFEAPDGDERCQCCGTPAYVRQLFGYRP